MKESNLNIVCYDFPSGKSGDRRRAKFIKYLKGFGVRVQKSVFEVRKRKDKEWEKLHEKIQSLLIPDEDSVRFYPLRKDQEKDVLIYGEGEIYSIDEDFYF